MTFNEAFYTEQIRLKNARIAALERLVERKDEALREVRAVLEADMSKKLTYETAWPIIKAALDAKEDKPDGS